MAWSLEQTSRPEVSVIMPCLNEAETIGTCIRKAQKTMQELMIEGEVIVADNGSTDGSTQIATHMGARVEHTCPQKVTETR